MHARRRIVSTTPGIKLVCTANGCEAKSVARRLCRAHYQQAWKAGELGQHQKLPPRPKKHDYVCPPEHKHAGAATCFIQHQCRCDPCVAAHNGRERRRTKLKAYGRFDTGLVDAEPVRAHILKLGEFGIGYKRVAELAGVGVTGVRSLIWGRQDPGDRYGEIPKRVAREKAEKILAVQATIENLGARQSVPSRGAHRRVQALVARGWSLSKIGDRIGVNRSNMGSFMKRPLISVASSRAIAALYEELWDHPPPHEEWRDKIAYSRSLEYARRRRWLPPLAWDDIDSDEEPPVPDEEDDVDEIAVELAMRGDRPRLRPLERRECVRRLHAEKWSDGRIADTIGCATKTVERIRDELGLIAFDQTELISKGAA
jgi:hypothetical protein